MGELTIQAGPNSVESSRDPKLGLVAVKLKCYAPDLDTALFAPPPGIGINIPEFNPRGISRRPAGDAEGYDVLIGFEGHPDPDAADGESFELDGSTSERPIETHWNYAVLLDVYKGNPKLVGKPDHFPQNITPAAQTSGGETFPNPMHGVDSWAVPGLIWNHNFCRRNLPSDLVKELATVTDKPPGNPPALSGGRNWLCIRLRATYRGNIWQIQKSWQLSDPHGFVPEMYAVVPS